MSSTISLDEAQLKLKELIHGMSPGDELVIIENQQPVAKIICELRDLSDQPRPPPGLFKGIISHIAPDFDAPLDDMKEYME